MKTKYKKFQQGFSLIELLVVATIMIVLMTIGLVSYRQASRNSRNAKRKSDLESVRQALVLYHNNNSEYPDLASDAAPTKTAFDTMLATITDYLSVSSVADPKDDGVYEYQYGSDSGNTFNLCASLETEAGAEQYCVTNP